MRTYLPEGGRLRPVKCPHCGEIVVTSAKYKKKCPHCRREFDPTAEETRVSRIKNRRGSHAGPGSRQARWNE